MERFTVWLHPFSRQQSGQRLGYQLIQGLYGMAFGGVFGTGLGAGQPYHTPLVQSDFIFTAFGEETRPGRAWRCCWSSAFSVQRGLRAALAVKDPFAKLLAAGPVVRARLPVLRHRRRRDPAASR